MGRINACCVCDEGRGLPVLWYVGVHLDENLILDGHLINIQPALIVLWHSFGHVVDQVSFNPAIIHSIRVGELQIEVLKSTINHPHPTWGGGVVD